METVWLVSGMALVTFSIRYLLLPLSGRIRFSPIVQRALGYVPPAVLTAIIVPAALLPDGGGLQLTWHNPYLIGAVLTAAIGWRFRNMLLTILGGMAAFAAWQWVLSMGWV
jgi:branched-subunit amino acid transport protein